MSSGNQQRIINLNVVPGEPIDGSGRVCIHLFVHSSEGAFTEPHVLIPVVKDGIEIKELQGKATRGGIACNLKRMSRKVTGNVISVTMRTDDPRAVTCPKCKETEIFKEMSIRNQ